MPKGLTRKRKSETKKKGLHIRKPPSPGQKKTLLKTENRLLESLSEWTSLSDEAGNCIFVTLHSSVCIIPLPAFVPQSLSGRPETLTTIEAKASSSSKPFPFSWFAGNRRPHILLLDYLGHYPRWQLFNFTPQIPLLFFLALER